MASKRLAGRRAIDGVSMIREEDIYSRLKQWLLNHIASLCDANGECRTAFELKRIHSLKVAEEITTIGRSLELAPADLFLARTIGLLHDTGRFEQFKTYRTFNDFVSVDHGDLGERIVAANRLLDDLDAGQQEIILKSIRHHNKIALPSGENDTVLFFIKLIRDADKLDIYRVVSERDHVPGTPPSNAVISDSLLDAMISGRRVSYQDLRSAAEMRLMQINWIFDINFEPTLRFIRERHCLDIMAATLPATDRVRAFIAMARRRLEDVR